LGGGFGVVRNEIRQALRASERKVEPEHGEQIDVEGAIDNPNDDTDSFRRSVSALHHFSRILSESSEWCVSAFSLLPTCWLAPLMQLAYHPQTDLGNMRGCRQTLLARKLSEVLEKYEAILDTVPVLHTPRAQPLVASQDSIPCFPVALDADGRARAPDKIDPHRRRFMVERDGIKSLCEWSMIFLVRSLRTYGEPDEPSQPTLPTPSEITWKTKIASNLNYCPLCKKVLFRTARTGSFSGRPP